MVELTKQEAGAILDFIENNIFQAIRNDPNIDSVTWLWAVMVVYGKCRKIMEES